MDKHLRRKLFTAYYVLTAESEMLRNREIMKKLMPEYHVTMNKSNGETVL